VQHWLYKSSGRRDSDLSVLATIKSYYTRRDGITADDILFARCTAAHVYRPPADAHLHEIIIRVYLYNIHCHRIDNIQRNRRVLVLPVEMGHCVALSERYGFFFLFN